MKNPDAICRDFRIRAIILGFALAGVWIAMSWRTADAGRNGTPTRVSAAVATRQVAEDLQGQETAKAACSHGPGEHHSLQPVAMVEEKSAPVSSPVPLDFPARIVSADEKTAVIPLPDGGTVTGRVTFIQRDEQGIQLVQGDVTAPEPGKFMFQRQAVAGVAGPIVGHVYFEKSDVAYQVRPVGKDGAPMLVKVTADEVICRSYGHVEEEAEPEQAPQTHPTDYPIPPGENGIIQLQSLPGATAVVYLDFDGEEDTFPGWGYINALPSSSATNSNIYTVWKGIAEDFQPFNINVTTVRAVYDAAPDGGRIQVIFTPTKDAAPSAGGVAYVGSFNSTGHQVCWVFYGSGQSAIEAGSHEIGHTIGLRHDGRTTPSETYYAGHNGWAPIMGVGYNKAITQFSKGEYPFANRTEDDLNIIVSNNNNVDYRNDDHGATFGASSWLDISPGGVVSNEGIIETRADEDSFRFTTTGGTLSLNINNVTNYPNLDVMAEIVTSAGVVVDTSNSDSTADASFSGLSLAAGDYFLRVSGVGKGEADLSTGYTDYGSLGTYLISGTINGGVPAEHFTLAENSANGSAAGTVAARANHGAGTPSFAIISGNTGGAFAINPATGAITVANSAMLDFEALSSRWDDPASFELFVSITDDLGVATESIRTVVTLTDVNEAPVIAALAAQNIPENLSPGSVIARATATDPDRTDYVSFSIVGGNTGNAFAIDSSTGDISAAGLLDYETINSYTLTIRATDHFAPVKTADTQILITLVNTVEEYAPGTIPRTFYNSITGSTVANLTGNSKFPDAPDSIVFLPSFDSGTNKADNYGSAMRAWLIPPVSGNHTFWISSDDSSELRISTDANPANAVVRASVSGSTGRYSWTSKSSQTSIAINLTAGQPYYIEARHKEGTGSDHLEVAWQGPGMAAKEVIPGRWLAPYNQNFAPKVIAATYPVRENAVAGQAIGMVTSSDVNAAETVSGYVITGGNTGGVFAIDPASGLLSVAVSGVLNAATKPSYTLTINSTDNGTPPLVGSGTVTVTVSAAAGINVTGIVQEIWTGISGTTISGLTGNTNYPYKPDVRRELSLFDTVSNYGDNYGSRIRAKFIPPSSGDYQFYVSGDDNSQLLFSTDPSGAGATVIASIIPYSGSNQWTKNASQTSAVKTLVAGQAVYLETLQKEGGGGDHISVGYTGPGVSTTTVIPVSMLEPFDINGPPVFSPTSYSFNLNGTTATAGTVVGTVSATDPNEEVVLYVVISGDPDGAFAIDRATGIITVANPALLTGGDVNLGVAAQDGGLEGVYPYATGLCTAVIHVTGLNMAPYFLVDPVTKPAAAAGESYSASLAGNATDDNPGDVLSFAKISGPDWLSVSTNGDLSGAPSIDDLGTNTFMIRVTDPETLSATSELRIDVTGTPWQIWQFDNFGVNAADPLIAGDHADTDRDGIVNLIENALDLDPNVPDTTAASVTYDLESIGEDSFPRLTISRNPAATDLLLMVEVSDDAVLWRTDQTVVEIDTPETLRVRDSEPIGAASKRFLHLKVTRP